MEDKNNNTNQNTVKNNYSKFKFTPLTGKGSNKLPPPSPPSNTNESTSSNSNFGRIPRNPIRKDKDYDYRKRGFFSAVNEKKNHDTILNSLFKIVDETSIFEIEALESIFTVKINILEERINDYQNQLIDRNRIKTEFEKELEEMKSEKVAIEKEIAEYRTQILEAIKEMSIAKETLILKRLSEIEKEMNRIVEIHETIENKQNPKFKKEFDDDKNIDKDKIEHYIQIKNGLEETYQDVKTRIRSLNNSGINVSWVFILVGIGWVCSLVAGWFFSLWSGPLPKLEVGVGIIQNGSVKFLLIDLIAKYTQNKNWTEIGIEVFAYIFFIGFIAALSFFLLKKFGFIYDANKAASIKNKLENDETYVLNPEEQDELLKGQFKADNWFALWLKAAPFITFIYLTLAVLSKNAFAKDERGDETNKFQEVYDSLTNQFIGSLIAIAFTGFVMLYIIKIIEPRTIAKTKDGRDDGKLSVNWELVSGAILFMVMIISMIFAKATISELGTTIRPNVIATTNPKIKKDTLQIIDNLSERDSILKIPTENHINDIQNYIPQIEKIKFPIFYEIFTVSGFLFFCLITGLCLGYGYRFIGLNDLQINLITYLEIYTLFINRLSKPKRVNYINDVAFKHNMEFIQYQMLRLVVKRNIIAQKLTGGKQESTKYIDSMLELLRKQIEEKAEEKEAKDKSNKTVEKKDDSSVITFFRNLQHSILIPLKSFFSAEKEKNEQEKLIGERMTEDEESYFPEYATKIKQINIEIEERKRKLKGINEELNGYWENKKTYFIINEQIKNINNEIYKLKDQIIKLGEELHKGKEEKRDELERKKILILEGFNTGLWFLKNGDDLRDKYLTI